MSDILNLGYKGLRSFTFPAPPSCLVDSGQLHYSPATVLGRCSMVLESPIFWSLHSNWDVCIFTNGLSYPLMIPSFTFLHKSVYLQPSEQQILFARIHFSRPYHMLMGQGALFQYWNSALPVLSFSGFVFPTSHSVFFFYFQITKYSIQITRFPSRKDFPLK